VSASFESRVCSSRSPSPQVNPANSVKTCFETNAPVSIKQYLPDTTGMTLQEDAVQMNNIVCDNWRIAVNTLGSISTYDLYVSRMETK
jgi:hypothetical protein